jgi:hypothetical protein
MADAALVHRQLELFGAQVIERVAQECEVTVYGVEAMRRSDMATQGPQRKPFRSVAGVMLAVLTGW